MRGSILHFYVPPASGNPPSTIVQRASEQYGIGAFSVTQNGDVMGFGMSTRPAPFNSLVTLFKPRLLTRIGGEWQPVQDLPELERSLNSPIVHDTCMEPDGTMYMLIKMGGSLSYVWKKPPGGQWGLPNPNAGLNGQPERLHNFDLAMYANAGNAHAFMPRTGGGAIIITGSTPYVVTLYPDGTQARGSTFSWSNDGTGHRVFRMPSGRIVLCWMRSESGAYYATIAWSDDEGATWEFAPDPTTHQNGIIVRTGWLGGSEFYMVYNQRLTSGGDVLQYNVFNMDTGTWRFPQSLPARSATNTVASAPRFFSVRVVGDMIMWSTGTSTGSITGTWARQITPTGLGAAVQMVVPGQSTAEGRGMAMVGPGKYLAGVGSMWVNYFDGTNWTGPYANIVPTGYSYSGLWMLNSIGPSVSGTVGVLSATTDQYATFSLDALDRPIA